MSKKRKDLQGDGAPLTANPFESLKPCSFPDSPSPRGFNESRAKEAAKPSPRESTPFQISRTRKGGLPISIEKRPGGKIVTLVRNVSGDADALLTWLKKKCGAGGVVREDTIEIQGDHVRRLEIMLADFMK